MSTSRHRPLAIAVTIGHLLAFLLASPAVSPAFSASPAIPTPRGRPNILLICVDDLKPVLGCYGAARRLFPRRRTAPNRRHVPVSVSVSVNRPPVGTVPPPRRDARPGAA